MKNKRLHKSIKAEQRINAMNAGFYDGRFATKSVEDKKRKANKYACRKKVNID